MIFDSLEKSFFLQNTLDEFYICSKITTNVENSLSVVGGRRDVS
jgi:hypothetical protein